MQQHNNDESLAISGESFVRCKAPTTIIMPGRAILNQWVAYLRVTCLALLDFFSPAEAAAVKAARVGEGEFKFYTTLRRKLLSRPELQKCSQLSAEVIDLLLTPGSILDAVSDWCKPPAIDTARALGLVGAWATEVSG